MRRFVAFKSEPMAREHLPPLMERFYAAHMPEPNSGCWLWTGPVQKNSLTYGAMTHRGRMFLAHRFAYAAFVADIPRDTYVLHRCDNPLCVNPDHLFLGDHYANIHDRDEKGRAARGEKSGRRLKPHAWDHSKTSCERHYAAKLTADQVRAIRTDPRSSRELSKVLGVSDSHIRRIRSRSKWGRLDAV